MHSGGFRHRTTRFYRWLQERFHLIHCSACILERDLDIPGGSRVKLCHNRLSIRNRSLEPGILRIEDRFIFVVVIVAIPVSVDVIRQRHCDYELPRVVTLQLPQAVAPKGDSINGRGHSKIDLDPAIRAIADPASTGPIFTVIEIRSIMDFTIPGNRIFCNSGSCQSMSLERQIAWFVEIGGPAQRRGIAWLANNVYLLCQGS